MAPLYLRAGCPDIGIDEVPTTYSRMNEIVRLAIDKARRHKSWEDVMDPRRKRLNKKDLEQQLGRIHIWKLYYEMVLLSKRNGETN